MTAFERPPDYSVVRLEGYILESPSTDPLTVPLRHVFDGATSDSQLRLEPEIRTGDSLLEGHIFSPDLPQPQLTSTVPLVRWTSRSRDDTLVTMDFRFLRGNPYDGASPRERIVQDYRFDRLLGYVFPPDRPRRDGTIPLWRWFSPSRLDNDTTSHASRQFQIDPE